MFQFILKHVPFLTECARYYGYKMLEENAGTYDPW
jgi:hypothetical protein